MLSERETRRLHEIEVHLRLTDPRLVRRFAVLQHRRAAAGQADLSRGRRSVHGSGPVPSALLALALVVLLVGAVTTTMAVVLAGIVAAVLALGVAASRGPQAGPRFA